MQSAATQMNRISTGRFRQGCWILGLSLLLGCVPTQFTTLTIYDTPQSFVRLEVDRTLDQGNGHSHPASLSSDHMATVLRGIIVQEPLTRLPFYDDLSVPRQHPAFGDQDIAFWAPLLSLALSRATPDEIVTFYQSTRGSGTTREVTSGGLFVDGEHLHIVLSNLQSAAHYAADAGVVDTQDDRLTPLRSMAPQRGYLLFLPESAQVSPSTEDLTRVFAADRRELIVLYKTLAPQPAASPAQETQQSVESLGRPR